MNIWGKIKEQFNKKSFRIGGYSVLVSIITIAIAIFAVMTVDSLSGKYTKIDMTDTALYSLSQESINVATAVDKDVTIYMLAQAGSEDKMTQNIVEKYAGYNSKIKVELKDPVVFPNFLKNYTDETLTNNSLLVVCGEKSRYISNNEIYTMTADDDGYSQSIEFNAENHITSALGFVTSDISPKLYYTSGHRETPLSASILSKIEKQNISAEEISLLTEKSMPEDADVVLINNPLADISKEEKDLLLTYLKNGGSMVLITGYNDTEMPVLNELMKNYGAERVNKLVLEDDAGMTISGYNYFLVPRIQNSKITNPLIEGKYNVLMPLAHPIERNFEKNTTAVLSKILITSTSAYTRENALSLENPERQEGDEVGNYAVGACITDSVENGETKIAWFSSAQILDETADSMVAGGNTDLFLNALNWMCEREDNIAIRAKMLENEMLTVPTSAKNIWSIVFIFVIPILFIAVGIYVIYKRRSKKNNK